MKKIKCTALCLALLPTLGLAAAYHPDKEVSIIHSPDGRECVFFQLSGVAEADAVIPGGGWFAVPKTHAGFKEIFALVLSARLAGKTVNVSTTGTIACGHAQVSAVTL